MPLQILTGSSGSGKTYQLYSRIIQSAMAQPGKRHVVLVPEQFTLQTQRMLVNMHPQHVIFNIEILSFEWLAHRVLRESGHQEYQILNDAGKSMLLRKSAGQHRKELAFFRKNLTRAGFINRVKSMLSELLQYGVTEEDLERLAGETAAHPLLQAKLKDLQVFYRAFRDNQENAIAAEELPALLLKELPQSDYLRGAVIGIDGFTGFTPIQYQIIREILPKAELIGITLTLPGTETLTQPVRGHELFAMTHETAEQLLRISEEAQVPVELFHCERGAQSAAVSPEILHLERHFLRYGKGRRYEEETKDIRLCVSRNPREEAARAVREIHRLTREKGYRYRDIAIVTADPEGYRPFLTEVLDREQIPYFMDQKKGIIGNPLVVFLRSAMESVEKGFPYEPVFRYLKSGLCGLSPEAVDLLENYVVATGRRGVRQWQESWERGYAGHENIDFVQLNVWREQAAGPLLRLREALREGTGQVSQATAALLALMEECQVEERLAETREQLLAAGERQRAEEFAQVAACVRELFLQVDQLLGQEKLSLRELGDVLDAGFAEVRIGTIPQSLDQVQVGDIERSRLTSIRALIFLGLNEGIVPKPEKDGGILTDEEREILRRHQLILAPTAKEDGCQEQFYLYCLLTKPTEEILLSFSKLSADGQALRPSWYISQVQRLFPRLKTEEEPAAELPVIDSWATALEVMAQTAGQLREQEPQGWWKELYLLLAGEPEMNRRLAQILDASFYRYEGSHIQKAVSRMLYGDALAGSVTRLEQYAACAYAQFLTYGLKLKERVEYQFDSMDRGSFFHQALEMVFREMKEREIDPTALTDEERRELVARGIEAAAEKGGAILADSAENSYYVERWKRITDRTVWAICEQLKKSDFRPAAMELTFDGARSAAMNLILGEEERMYLRGVVDRLDLYEDDARVYVRIVDYKTGRNAVDLNAVYHGLQLQLIVYLDAVMEMEQQKHPDKEIIPAGIYYYQIQDPLIESAAPLEAEELEGRLLKELRLKGLTNAGNHVAEHTEETAGEEITPQEFSLLRKHVRKCVQEFGRGILSGEISAAPYRREKGSACDYCAFSSVCGFDPKLPGYRYRSLKKLDKEGIWEKLGEEDAHGREVDPEAEGNY